MAPGRTPPCVTAPPSSATSHTTALTIDRIARRDRPNANSGRIDRSPHASFAPRTQRSVASATAPASRAHHAASRPALYESAHSFPDTNSATTPTCTPDPRFPQGMRKVDHSCLLVPYSCLKGTRLSCERCDIDDRAALAAASPARQLRQPDRRVGSSLQVVDLSSTASELFGYPRPALFTRMSIGHLALVVAISVAVLVDFTSPATAIASRQRLARARVPGAATRVLTAPLSRLPRQRLAINPAPATRPSRAFLPKKSKKILCHDRSLQPFARGPHRKGRDLHDARNGAPRCNIAGDGATEVGRCVSVISWPGHRLLSPFSPSPPPHASRGGELTRRRRPHDASTLDERCLLESGPSCPERFELVLDGTSRAVKRRVRVRRTSTRYGNVAGPAPATPSGSSSTGRLRSTFPRCKRERQHPVDRCYRGTPVRGSISSSNPFWTATTDPHPEPATACASTSTMVARANPRTQICRPRRLRYDGTPPTSSP